MKRKGKIGSEQTTSQKIKEGASLVYEKGEKGTASFRKQYLE